MNNQARTVIEAFENSIATGRGEWGALAEALRCARIADRMTSGQPPETVIIYRLADGTELRRRASESTLRVA